MKKILRAASEAILAAAFITTSALALDTALAASRTSDRGEAAADSKTEPGAVGSSDAGTMGSGEAPEPYARTLEAGLPAAAPADGLRYSPAEIAVLFGWRPPAAPRPAVRTPVEEEPSPSPEPEPPEDPKPVKAVWIQHIGTVTGSDGRPVYFLKDTRKKQVIRVVEGETNDGYLALAADGRYFLLEKDTERYEVITQ